MTRRRALLRMPPAAVLATVGALVVSYVPETGLDHLHLHLEDGLTFVHEHLHVGHHEHSHHHGQHHHGHHSPSAPDGGHDDEPADEPDGRSSVVTYTRAAQVQPAVVDTTLVHAPVRLHDGPRSDGLRRAAAPRPSWSPRAPPAV